MGSVIPYDGFFFVKSGVKGRTVRIDVQRILYIEAAQNYVLIYSEQERNATYLTMAEIEAVLDPEFFLRVHKSYIVNLRMIKAIEGASLIVSDQKLINIGETYRTRLEKKLKSITVISKRH